MTVKSAKLRLLLRKFASLFFPPKCPACGTVTGSSVDGELCENCRTEFAESYITVCPECGHKSESCGCPPDFAKNESNLSPYTTVMPLIFSGYYTGYDKDSVISTLVYKMKRQRLSNAGLLFARIIAQRISREFALRKLEPNEFIVTYIPRSEDSFEKYGFDHMETVAKRVSEMLGCRFESLLTRNGGTAQKELSAAERSDNAYKSLSASTKKAKVIRGAKIIVLDDIITTGSSMRAAVSKLSFAGADTIIPSSAMVSITGKYKGNRKIRSS